ncbi:MAG: RNA methyltransferase [Bacteroidaceae bacterium]|nr:RNA methyltransferase [Bacteroidaceae bacterium]
MLSKNRVKSVRALAMKKERDQLGLFVAEGPKLVAELWQKFRVSYVAATSSWLKENAALVHSLREVDEVSEEELRRVSLLQHPQSVLAVMEKPRESGWEADVPARELCLALDDVQDPGNVGTILRLADWFGIHYVWCSPQTADVYGPKVVQATMGALARVEVRTENLEPMLASVGSEVPVYGTFLDGDNLYAQHLEQRGIIVMGNEGKGIRPAVARMVSRRLLIPGYPEGQSKVESLNVAMATAIVCAEFRRRAGQ